MKLLALDNQAIPKKIYTKLKTDAENNTSYNGSNRSSQIKPLLNELELDSTTFGYNKQK